MNIIGINAGQHDSSASLIIDGKLIASCAEERFTRIKHDPAYPINAIKFCLQKANLTFKDIDHVAYSWDYFSYEFPKLNYHINKALDIAKLENSDSAISYLQTISKNKEKIYSLFMNVEEENKKYFEDEIIKVPHHMSHAYSVFPLSGFKSCAVMIIDGSGEKETVSFWHFKDHSLKFIKSYDLPHSVGTFYGAITQFLGFLHHDEEWKVMGWAPYGEPKYYDIMKQMYDFERMELNLAYFQHQIGKFPWFSEKLIEELQIEPRRNGDTFEQVYADIAASSQKVLEHIVVQLAREIKTLTNEEYLCMAGGVALNGKANGEILNNNIFKEVFVQPVSADDGTSIGAALKVAFDKGYDIFHPLTNVYYGPEYDDNQCYEALEESQHIYKQLSENELYDYLAKQLSNGKVVGWFQGGSEMGPRALGNRSIIADPRNNEMKDILNKKIKFREPFRPFAPSVLSEYANEYFDGNLTKAYFMNQIFQVKPEKQQVIPAVTHEDKTARVQLVEKSVNEKYHRLISAFYKETGVPILINTSFNVKGEPIVNSPEDAINCFNNTGIDILVLNNYIIEK